MKEHTRKSEYSTKHLFQRLIGSTCQNQLYTKKLSTRILIWWKYAAQINHSVFSLHLSEVCTRTVYKLRQQ